MTRHCLYVQSNKLVTMEKVTITEVKLDQVNAARRRLTNVLKVTNLGINYYEVEPGKSLSGGYHAHNDQEEIFYIQSGTATFVTTDGEMRINPGEVIRFGPGEFHHSYNSGNKPLTVLAIGAPQNSKEVDSLRECPVCDEIFVHHRPSLMGEISDESEYTVNCPNCSAETHRRLRPP